MTHSFAACKHGAIERLHGAASKLKRRNTMSTNTQTKSAEAAKPPIAKLRLGLINASIWQRTTGEDAFYSVSFERRYKDAQGNCSPPTATTLTTCWS